MIDAGESEENIAKVIQHAKSSGGAAPGDTITARASMNTQEGRPGVLSGMMSMGEGMMRPKNLTDLTSLLLPDLGQSAGAINGGIRELGSRSYQAFKAAGKETTGIRSAATLPVRAFGKFRDALPSRNAAAVEKFMGPESTVVKKPQTLISGADIIDRNLPAVKPATVPKPPMAKAPTLDATLQQALEEAMASKEPALRSTGAPVAETTAGGSFKQSWPKSKQQNLGGYSSGNPSTTTEVANEVTPVVDNAVEAEAASKPAAAAPNREPVRASEPVVEPDVTVTDTPTPEMGAKPKLSAEETAGMLRRMFGSRDGGRMLYGDSLPAAERGAAIKRLAPGPSQTPLSAEARINGMPQDQSLEDILRQIILDKSKVP